MVEILRNKNLATRFQILVEMAANQPDVRQKYIARRLGITPQAVSDYIKQLLKEGLLLSEGRLRYRVSIKGVDWMLRQLKEVQEYLVSVTEVVNSVKVSAAIAGADLQRGQTVGLVMRDGLLVATEDSSAGATGVIVSDAAGGDDVGVTNVRGIINLEAGEITVLGVPGVQRGGSKNTALDQLENLARTARPLAAIGVEAISALKRIGCEPDYVYGAREAVIEAANSGLSPLLVCVDEEVPMLIKRLGQAGIRHRLLNLRIS
jgi:putative transcriptional regulator